MQQKNQQDFIDLVKHWNQNYQFEETEGNNEDINIEEDLLKLAPSEKLFNAAVSLKNKNQVLDYGCGSGWASIIAAYKGCEKIISVDVIPNGCKLTNYYARAFKVNDRIQIKQIDEEWLKNEKDQSYDGIFCSNVIDVVPFEMAESIVKELSRLLTNDGLAIISFNFFMNLKAAQERGFTVKDKQVYINGVLRLLILILKNGFYLIILKTCKTLSFLSIRCRLKEHYLIWANLTSLLVNY